MAHPPTGRPDRILIVGAGITGLAASVALRAIGAEVTVIEQRESPPHRGLGLNLPGNAVRALRELRRADEVLAAGVEVRRREYVSARGRRLFTVDESSFWSDVAPSVSVRHRDLLRALAREQDVHYGVGVDRIRLDDLDDGRPHVRTTDGQDRTYDLVLGADGVHSRIRAAITTVQPQPSAMTAAAWRFVTTNPGVDSWTAWTGDGLVLLLLPISRSEVYGYAAANGGGAVGTSCHWLLDAFRRFPEVARTALTSAVAGVGVGPRRDPVEEVRANRWHRGRAAVLGDAAHATGPVWAQGAGMGLEDATVLAREIATNGAGPAALRAWEARRRPRVEHVQAVTERMSRVARMPDQMARHILPLLGPRTYESAYGALRATP